MHTLRLEVACILNIMVVLKNTGWNHEKGSSTTFAYTHLSAEAVKGLALTLESVDNIESRHRLAAGMLGVRHGVLDDVLKEGLEDATGLLVHHTGDALDTTTTRNAADSGLGNALDVVAHHLTMTLGGSLAFTFA